MKCVILAAGRGSRLLKNSDIPKPLIKLNGVPLIERQILNFYQAGIREFIIIVGFLGDILRKHFESYSLAGCTFTFIENKEWQRENGLSLLKAKPFIDGTFCFTMCDHYFESNLVNSFLKNKLEDNEVLLGIDYPSNKNTHIDIDDVTKVSLEGSKIIDIGKNIKNYQAYDTGLFLGSPHLFTTIEKTIITGDATISGSIRSLSRNNKAGVVYVGDYYWNDIDNESDLASTEKYLLEL